MQNQFRQPELLIDGAHGEGGGQILRTALGLSLVTGRPFRLVNIRAGRNRPGLLAQHLAAVNAAADIGASQVQGAALGSRELSFAPHEARPGEYEFKIGTAGSATLVLQAVLPALLCASTSSTIVIEGGTHNLAAPPFDFLARAFLPLVNRMGPGVQWRLARYGFYPAGGGRVEFVVQPAGVWQPLTLNDRGAIRAKRVRAIVSRVPLSIAHRELQVIAADAGWQGAEMQALEVSNSPGPGNILLLEIDSEHVTEVFTGFGQKGLRAEAVAEMALREASEYLAGGAPVGQHLADQLQVPLALAGGGSYVTSELTPHATTNMDVIRRFLDVKLSAERVGDQAWMVTARQ